MLYKLSLNCSYFISFQLAMFGNFFLIFILCHAWYSYMRTLNLNDNQCLSTNWHASLDSQLRIYIIEISIQENIQLAEFFKRLSYYSSNKTERKYIAYALKDSSIFINIYIIFLCADTIVGKYIFTIFLS